MSDPSLSQKIIFSLVCIAVVVLLLPYAGCHVGSFNSEDHPEERELMPNRSGSFPARQQGHAETSPKNAREPLDQIEDLLSN